jgi:hypothetical protein
MLLYIDPGSGSIILQLVIAGVTGFIFIMATLKNKIKAMMVIC